MAETIVKSCGWQKTLTELKEYIAANPGIRIERDHIIIPENVRSEFYRLFNDTRTSSVDRVLPTVFAKSCDLSENFKKVKGDLRKTLGIEEVSMRPDLDRFLQNPKEELVSKIFNALFDVLKGNTSIEVYEAEVYKKTFPYFTTLYRDGYEKWMLLSLVKMLTPGKLLQANCRKYCSPEEAVRAKKSHPAEPVPVPEEAKSILFHFDNVIPLMMADVIIYSEKTGKYISTRSHFTLPFNTAGSVSVNREWYSFEEALRWNDGITLLYTDSGPNDIALVAHAGGVCRPDIIIACESHAGWFESEKLNQIKACHDNLKPRLGTYIISKESVPDELTSCPEKGVYIICAGFDADKLSPIVDLLACENPA